MFDVTAATAETTATATAETTATTALAAQQH